MLNHFNLYIFFTRICLSLFCFNNVFSFEEEMGFSCRLRRISFCPAFVRPSVCPVVTLAW